MANYTQYNADGSYSLHLNSDYNGLGLAFPFYNGGNPWHFSGVDKALTEVVNRYNDYKFAHDEAALARESNSAEALKDRNWQAQQAEINRQFNSAEALKAYDRSVDYSRQVDEMKKAGLNPAMMYSSGDNVVGSSMAASAGAVASGSRASSGAASAGSSASMSASPNILSGLVNAAVQLATAYVTRGTSLAVAKLKS